MVHNIATFLLRVRLTVEGFERCTDFIFLNDFLKLTLQVLIKLVSILTLFFGISTVEDADLFVRVMQLPGLPLILFVEIYDEKRVLEVDEKVAHVSLLFRFFLICYDIEGAETTLMTDVDLIFQLLLRVAARYVLDA